MDGLLGLGDFDGAPAGAAGGEEKKMSEQAPPQQRPARLSLPGSPRGGGPAGEPEPLYGLLFSSSEKEKLVDGVLAEQRRVVELAGKEEADGVAVSPWDAPTSYESNESGPGVELTSLSSAHLAAEATARKDSKALLEQVHSWEPPSRKKETAAFAAVEDTAVEWRCFGVRIPLFDPEGTWKRVWDLWVGLLIIWSVLYVPWLIGFEPPYNDSMDSFDIFVDVNFLLDILATFNTAVLFDGAFISDYRTIARLYVFHGTFLTDLLSSLPIDEIVELAVGETNNLETLRILRFLRLIRLFKLVRLTQLNGRLAILRENSSRAALSLLSLLFQIVFLAHLVACVWFAVNRCHPVDSDDVGDIDIVTCGCDDGASQYTAALYWVTYTITAVGYGEVTVKTQDERLFAIFAMLIGILISAVIIGTISRVIEDWNKQAQAASAHKEDMADYLRAQSALPPLERRVADHLDGYFSLVSALPRDSTMCSFSDALEVKLWALLHYDHLGPLTLLREASFPALRVAVRRLKPARFAAGEVVLLGGAIAQEGYFVSEGSVAMCEHRRREDDAGLVDDVLLAAFTRGDDFECAGAWLGRPPPHSYKAASDCLLFWLGAEDLAEVAREDAALVPRLLKAQEALDALLRAAKASPVVRTGARSFARATIATRRGAADGRSWRPPQAPTQRVDGTAVVAGTVLRTLREPPAAGLKPMARAGGLLDAEAPAVRGRREGAGGLAEGEETVGVLAARYIVYPEHPWKVRWDIAIALLIVVSAVTVPVRLGFTPEQRDGWLALDVPTDVLFFLDMVASFRTAFADDAGAFVTAPWHIAARYLRGWFLVDFFSTAPLDYAISGSARGLKLVRVARLARLLRLARVAKLRRNRHLEGLFSNEALVRGVKLAVGSFVLAHLFGSFFAFTGSEASTCALDPRGRTALAAAGFGEKPMAQRYFAAVYWAFTTMTTEGYGDIVAVNDPERAYAVAIMVLGTTVFGYIVGTVMMLAEKLSGNASREQDYLLVVTEYLKEQEMPREVRQRVEEHYDYVLSVRTVFLVDEGAYGVGDLVRKMPHALRREVALLSAQRLENVALLSPRQPVDLVAHMADVLAPRLFSPREVVYGSELESEGVYFVDWGRVRKEHITRDAYIRRIARRLPDPARTTPRLRRTLSLSEVELRSMAVDAAAAEEQLGTTLQREFAQGDVFGYDAFLEPDKEQEFSAEAELCTGTMVLYSSAIVDIMLSAPALAEQLQHSVAVAINDSRAAAKQRQRLRMQQAGAARSKSAKGMIGAISPMNILSGATARQAF